MANLINEAKRMQHLAGIITESQLNEDVDKNKVSQVYQIIDKALDGKFFNSENPIIQNQDLPDLKSYAATAEKKPELAIPNELKGRAFAKEQKGGLSDAGGDSYTVSIGLVSKDKNELTQAVGELKKQSGDMKTSATSVYGGPEVFGVKFSFNIPGTSTQAEAFDIEETVNESQLNEIDAKALAAILQPIAKEEGFVLFNQAVDRSKLNAFLKANKDKQGGLVVVDSFSNPEFVFVIHNDQSKIDSFRRKVNDQHNKMLMGTSTEKVDNIIASVNRIDDDKQPQAEALDIEEIVNEALKAVRKEQTNEIFGFGAPSLKVGDEIKVKYDKPITMVDGDSDGQYFKAKLTQAPDKFEVTEYKASKFDFDNGNAKKVSIPLLYRGIETTISGKNGYFKVGEPLKILGSLGPKVTELKLNDKKESKIDLPKK